MTSTQPQNQSATQHALSAMQRKPRRITITLNQATYEHLLARCDREGRSLSNLCAFMLEAAALTKIEPVSPSRDGAARSRLWPLVHQ